METLLINNDGSLLAEVTAIESPLWWQQQGLTKTRSGYGTKIPTQWKVNFQGRDRRVYVDQYSNAGHTYIIVKGQKITVR
uniref:Uncharacterized protein n=1 Tax=Salmonella phage SalP219 TaxID=3158864 RepID=A0AAU7PKK1_9CAUD